MRELRRRNGGNNDSIELEELSNKEGTGGSGMRPAISESGSKAVVLLLNKIEYGRLGGGPVEAESSIGREISMTGRNASGHGFSPRKRFF
jgi:hypothetical protein